MGEKITVDTIRKGMKFLMEQNDKEPLIIEVENPKVKTDFLRVIDKSELVNKKLVIDNEGNTKQVYVKPTLLL